MKTDPKNSDYTVESGASRNYEPWRDKATQEEEAEREREEEEEGDAMKALENRTKESKREMDIMAALDEMRSLNARNAKVSLNDALGAIHGKIDAERKRAEEAEEAQAKAVFAEAQKAAAGFVRRLESDSDSDGAGAKRPRVGEGDVLGGGSNLPKVAKPAFLAAAQAQAQARGAAQGGSEAGGGDEAGGGGGWGGQRRGRVGLLGDYGSSGTTADD